MSKSKQHKKDKKLRQSIEILKAQLKTDESMQPAVVVSSTSKNTSPTKIDTLDDNQIKKDLTKTVVLSAVSFGVIVLLWMFDITSFRF